MIQNYLLYLGYITNKIQGYFREQNEYIFCKKGCAKCCKNAMFPYTEIEFNLIKNSFNILDSTTKNEIIKNINKTLEKRNEFAKTNDKIRTFRYDCPFLINNECSVYYYRGLVCRSFGLMSFLPDSEKTPRIPFCAFEGLNYSNVLDEKELIISDVKFNQLDLKEEPKAYNVDYSVLINEEIAEGFGFKFGEVKPLIEWLDDDNKY